QTKEYPPNLAICFVNKLPEISNQVKRPVLEITFLNLLMDQEPGPNGYMQE
ncbi:15508_t:CDS:1, partial [Racocetra persica]